MGERGYDEEDVDAFLDEVEQELARLVAENAALRDRLQQTELSASDPSTMTHHAELADIAAQIERMQAARARAEEHARTVRAELEQARRAAITGSATGGNERVAPVLMMARRTADDHLHEAELASEALLSESREEAAMLTSEAQLTAAALENDARRDYTDAINGIEVERAALLDEIDRLGRLAESYRSALRGHLIEQLQDLDVAEPA
jgi:cell division septum initiation protein DivIVA